MVYGEVVTLRGVTTVAIPNHKRSRIALEGGGVSGSACQTREMYVTFLLWRKIRNSLQFFIWMNIFCKVKITGNQGVDVCCADRQCVPLIVSTNSIFVVGSRVMTLHGPEKCSIVCPNCLLCPSSVCLRHIPELHVLFTPDPAENHWLFLSYFFFYLRSSETIVIQKEPHEI